MEKWESKISWSRADTLEDKHIFTLHSLSHTQTHTHIYKYTHTHIYLYIYTHTYLKKISFDTFNLKKSDFLCKIKFSPLDLLNGLVLGC